MLIKYKEYKEGWDCCQTSEWAQREGGVTTSVAEATYQYLTTSEGRAKVEVPVLRRERPQGRSGVTGSRARFSLDGHAASRLGVGEGWRGDDEA